MMAKKILMTWVIALSGILGIPAFGNTESDEIITCRVRGEWPLSPDSGESPKEAFFKAQNEARRQALIQVCGERIASWDTLMTDGGRQTLSGVIVTDSVGIIHKTKIIRRGWAFPCAGDAEVHEYPSVFVEAEVSVKRSSEESDPTFTALIEGGKSCYKNGEQDTFLIKTARDAFLTVFWLNHDFQADIVFPANRWENNHIKPERKTPEIPLIFEISAPRAKREAGTLFFVLTKNPYPFLKSDKTESAEENRDRLERWMAAIPLQERFIYAVPFVIER